MRTTLIQQQQQQQLQQNHQQLQPQLKYNDQKDVFNNMKREVRDQNKVQISQQAEQEEFFNGCQQNFHYHQAIHAEGQGTQRMRSKTSFLNNLELDTPKINYTEHQQDDNRMQERNNNNYSKVKIADSASYSCKNSVIPLQNESNQQQQKLKNQAFVDQDEFRKYRNYIDNRSKASKSQILSNTQNVSSLMQGNNQDTIINPPNSFKEKPHLQITLPNQSIENTMSFGGQQELKQKQQSQNLQNPTQQFHTARSTSNLQEVAQTNKIHNNLDFQDDPHHNKIGKTKSQRDNVKYQSIHYQNEFIGNNYQADKQNYQKGKPNNVQYTERTYTLPDQHNSKEEGNSSQPHQLQFQEQLIQQNSFRQQQSKIQRKSCILDQYRSEQIQLQYTQRDHSNNNIQESNQKGMISQRNLQTINNDNYRKHQNNTPSSQNNFDLPKVNSSTLQQQQQKNRQHQFENQHKQSLERQSSASNFQSNQNQQNLLSHRQQTEGQINQNTTKPREFDTQKQPTGDKTNDKIQQIPQNQICKNQQNEDRYKEQLAAHKEQIQQLQTHNRQLLSQLKILESDNSNQIQKMKQLQEEVQTLEQNLQISNHSKEQAIIQHQNLAEQFQKLEEEIKLIREQSSKFTQERNQNQQQFSIDLRNWTSQNNYSFDETSSSPFSINNFASAKSAATTTTIFSQKSSTCIMKPANNQPSSLQQQTDKQQQISNQQQNIQISPQQHQQQYINFQNQLQNNNYQQFQQNSKVTNPITARDGTSIFEQTFSQDDQHQLQSQESRKSQIVKKIESMESQSPQNGMRNVNKSNSAAFDILYSIYQKFGDGQVDQLDQLPEKINNLLQENKLNGKFIKSMKELMMKCAPTNYFETTEPSLKIVWKFIKRVMEEYMILKSKSKQMGDQLAKQAINHGDTSQSPISHRNTQNTNNSFSNFINNNPQSRGNCNENTISSCDQNINTSNFNNKNLPPSEQNPDKTIQVICKELEISLERQILPKINHMKSSINKINECVEFIQSNQNENMKSVEEIKLYILRLFREPINVAQGIASND